MLGTAGRPVSGAGTHRGGSQMVLPRLPSLTAGRPAPVMARMAGVQRGAGAAGPPPRPRPRPLSDGTVTPPVGGVASTGTATAGHPPWASAPLRPRPRPGRPVIPLLRPSLTAGGAAPRLPARGAPALAAGASGRAPRRRARPASPPRTKALTRPSVGWCGTRGGLSALRPEQAVEEALPRLLAAGGRRRVPQPVRRRPLTESGGGRLAPPRIAAPMAHRPRSASAPGGPAAGVGLFPLSPMR